MIRNNSEPPLSIVIAVVSGKKALLSCLEGLYDQARRVGAEIIVPFDRWTGDVVELAEIFPDVRFVESSSSSPSEYLKPYHHMHFDRRRATGISNAQGRVIAMTEDHAIPAADWCEQILRAHARLEKVGVIGGAVENAVDDPLNWAWYYCDFGRYGRPLTSANVDYVSDVNVSYKRVILISVKDTWQSAFRETNVHWALRRSGQVLHLDPNLVIYQHRPRLSLGAVIRERIEWGRAFAETRSREIGKAKRGLFAIGTLLLPALLFARAIMHVIRQRRSPVQILRLSPLIIILVVFWSIGEAIGYAGRSRDGRLTGVITAESSVSGIS